MKERTLRSRRVFSGKLLVVDVVDVKLGNGRRSVREMVRHPGAVAVLARCPDRLFLLVRQFRKPVEQELLEVVAGTLEPGEAPRECAVRELREETGHSVRRMRKLGVLYLAPGYSSEVLHVFFADARASGQQEPDDDESLDVVRMTGPEIERAIAGGRVKDSKTLAVWLLYMRRAAR